MRLPQMPLVDGPLPLWPPILAARAEGSRSAGHAHHAMHLVLAREGSLRVQRGADAPWDQAAGVLTAPDVPHAIDADGVSVLLVFFDPESDVGASLHAALAGPVRLVSDAERDALVDVDPMSLMRSEQRAWMDRLLATLGATAVPSRRAMHPRVKKLLAYLRAADPETDTSLEALAAEVGLSPGRLMHAFTESIGVPLRPYLAWLKLQRAAAGVVSGLPLGQAAHAAGFADAAHMTRTFRRAFGMTPSMLRGPAVAS
ncbi:Transcriptional regulator, AraC family protein [Minicystis rosea]|nr:Transcriptional regulator, AraC family protein [Minicystis rosea]